MRIDEQQKYRLFKSVFSLYCARCIRKRGSCTDECYSNRYGISTMPCDHGNLINLSSKLNDNKEATHFCLFLSLSVLSVIINSLMHWHGSMVHTIFFRIWKYRSNLLIMYCYRHALFDCQEMRFIISRVNQYPNEWVFITVRSTRQARFDWGFVRFVSIKHWGKYFDNRKCFSRLLFSSLPFSHLLIHLLTIYNCDVLERQVNTDFSPFQLLFFLHHLIRTSLRLNEWFAKHSLMCCSEICTILFE